MRTWQRLLRRLYLLAVGSVVLSVALALLVATRMAPATPGSLRSTLSRLAEKLDDAKARSAELRRLHDEADLELAVYEDDGRLVDANVDPPPSPPSLPPRALRGVPFGEPPSFFPAPGAPAPSRQIAGDHPADDRPPDDRPPDERRPNERVLRTPRGPARVMPAIDLFHSGPDMNALALRLASPSGTPYLVVVATPGDSPVRQMFAIVGAVLALLMLMSIPFVTTLARPIKELARATRAFGQGDVTARADPAKAGAFLDLADAFNEMAEQVAASRRQERELLANVSHELRTPLTRIRIALGLAVEGSAELARESLTDIECDLSELETLIDDILTTTRLDGGGASLRRVPTAVASVIDDAARRFRTAYPRHTLAVEVRAEELPTLCLDAVLVRRALDNLLDNAGKYSEPGGQVALRADVDALGTTLVVIEDHGIGISPDDQRELFTPFFRAERSRTREQGGVGLGLALARKIIVAHGGEVWISSELGRGTTVHVRLPPPTAAFPANPPPARAGAGNRSMTR